MTILLPHTAEPCDTLIDLLQIRADTTPHAIAYRFLSDNNAVGDVVTYQELLLRARAIAASLQQAVKQGDRAILIYAPGLELIATFFGCLLAGVIAVPVYPPTNQKFIEKLQRIIEDSKPSIILTTAESKHKFTLLKIVKWIKRLPLGKMLLAYFLKKPLTLVGWDLEKHNMCATDTISTKQAKKWRRPLLSASQIAFLQYTSGSTGHPKGVMVTHANLLHNLSIIYRTLQVHRKSSFVFWLPPYHDMGLIGGILEPLFAGAPSTLMSPMQFLKNPFAWLKAIMDYQATITAAPNFAFDYCVKKVTNEQKKMLDLSSMELMLNGAEPIHPKTLETFSDAFRHCHFKKNAIYPSYGLAEATLFVSGGKCQNGFHLNYFSKQHLQKNKVHKVSYSDPDAHCLVSAGFPADDVRIVNPDTNEECDSSQMGEVWIHSDSVAAGYWSHVPETEKIFKAHIKNESKDYLCTGDLGFISEGELYIAGRAKDLIILHGCNYYPQDFEYVASHCHPLLNAGNCAAFSVIDDDGEQLILVCEMNVQKINEEDNQAVSNAILLAIANHFGVPVKRIALIPAKTLPKTTSGKVRRLHIKNLLLENKLDCLYQWTVANELVNSIPSVALFTPNPKLNALDIQQWLIGWVQQNKHISLKNIDINHLLIYYGMDSLDTAKMCKDLEDWLHIKVDFDILSKDSIKNITLHLSKSK